LKVAAATVLANLPSEGACRSHRIGDVDGSVWRRRRSRNSRRPWYARYNSVWCWNSRLCPAYWDYIDESSCLRTWKRAWMERRQATCVSTVPWIADHCG